MLKADIEKLIEKIHDKDREIKRILKVIRKIERKNRNSSDLFLRLNELNISETDIRNKIDALKQIIPHIEEVKEQVKVKTIVFKKILKHS